MKEKFNFFKVIRLCGLLLTLFIGNTGTCQIIGIISDHLGKPIEGVEVFTKFEEYTFSNVDGNFQITSQDGDTLYFQHISYFSHAVLAKPNPMQIELSLSGHVLDQIEVNSNWVYDHQAVTQSTVNKQELESRNLGQDIPYLLRWSPSTVVTSDGGTGIGYTYLRIRGSDQERINFTINGVPLNDSESQQVFWVDLPDFASSTNQVQIQRGLGLSTNGAGSFGASVNFSTSSFSQVAQGSFTAGVGSFGTYRASTQFESGKLSNHYYLKGSLSKLHSDGYIDRARADLHSLFVGAGAEFGDHSIQANIFSGSEVTYQAWNGVPVNFVDDDVLRRSNSAGTERPISPHPDEVDDYDQTHSQLIYQWNINPQITSKFTAHYTRGEGFFELYHANETLADFSIDPIIMDDNIVLITDLIERRWLANEFYGLIGSFHYIDTDNSMRIKWGGAWSEYKGQHFGEVIWTEVSNSKNSSTRYYDNDATKNDWNIYTQIFKDITPHLNVFGDVQYRQVSHDFLGFDENANELQDKVTHRFFNPKAGINYAPTNRNKIYFYAGYGHKEPNRNDFTSSSPSSRPQAEKLLNLELGYAQKISDKIELNANGYWMKYDDQLVPTGQLNDVGAANRINVENSYRLGLEWGVDILLSSNLDFGLGGTFSFNKIREIDFFRDKYDADFEYAGQVSEIMQNVNLPFSPSSMVQGQIGWRPVKRFKILWESKYISRQYLDNNQSRVASLDPYSFSNLTLDFHVGKNLNKGFTIRLLIQNLFDTKYESFGWTYPYIFPGQTSGDYTVAESTDRYRDIGLYPQAGRNFLMSGTFNF